MALFDVHRWIQELEERGLSPQQRTCIHRELNGPMAHEPDFPIESDNGEPQDFRRIHRLYDLTDGELLQHFAPPMLVYHANIKSIDELLERDRQKEKDGFPRKIRIGRLIKPGRGKDKRFIVVPTTVEEKFIHDRSFRSEQEQESEQGGAGEGEEGEVIGEQPIRPENGEGEQGPGQGESGPHEIESSAYELGRILTEKFELPRLQHKGKKKSLTKYTYDLTDRHRGFGQLLDKKATLRKIVETNISLGNIPDVSRIDPSSFLVAPQDKVYRVLSKEKDYESQAMVFFLRDYSGSMSGKPTELVVGQHVLIYSWLLYQYSNQVESRFILHDTEAKEVPDFYTYYNSKVAGGTRVASAFALVDEIVHRENLEPDYNIYVFHGTDGDDWDTDGKETIPEIIKVLAFSNRVGITIAQSPYSKSKSEVQRYMEKSGLLNTQKEALRMDVVPADADEARLIEGIKTLIKE